MAGTMTRGLYIGDDGTHYSLRMPNWVFTLTGASAPGATDPPKPTGLRPRRRYARITATGEERSFVVGDPASAIWTDAMGTAVTLDTGVYGSTGLAALLQGATGERRKHI